MEHQSGEMDYPWSSVPGYGFVRRCPKWLSVERGIAMFQWEDCQRHRSKFQAYTGRLAHENTQELYARTEAFHCDCSRTNSEMGTTMNMSRLTRTK